MNPSALGRRWVAAGEPDEGEREIVNLELACPRSASAFGDAQSSVEGVSSALTSVAYGDRFLSPIGRGVS
jgi:hypothetical protein